MWTPGPTWCVLHRGGPPLLVPLVTSDWGIWASSPETDQDPCPGWLPPVPLDLVSPQKGFSPGPLTPRFKGFPPPEFRALPFVCFLSGTWHRANWKTLLIYDKNHGLTPLENLDLLEFFKTSFFWPKKHSFLSRRPKKRSFVAWFAQKNTDDKEFDVLTKTMV